MTVAAEKKSLLRTEGISVVFQQRRVLHEVDLQIESGEVVTIIGPNGAGKTTLVRVALGLLKPTSGSIHLDPVIRVGYLPQRFEVEPTLPINVDRFLKLTGVSDGQRIQQALEEVNAGRLLKTSLQSLSGGEQQRVLLARALLRNPDLLVLDEPAQGVDLHGQVEFFSLLEKLRSERGCSVLMVSHDLHLVMAATDRVICLNTHVCCKGTPEMVTRNPAFIELFGEEAAKNLAIYAHDRGHRHEL
ncbi:MAG: zinc ABC transporter ATP-binding protein ZnuC [Desulfuromonas sp.]|nr:MAG: zinc ABC transporter ATP-binding protein ZnuC [Desulfuromonas sp.]